MKISYKEKGKEKGDANFPALTIKAGPNKKNQYMELVLLTILKVLSIFVLESSQVLESYGGLKYILTTTCTKLLFRRSPTLNVLIMYELLHIFNVFLCNFPI